MNSTHLHVEPVNVGKLLLREGNGGLWPVLPLKVCRLKRLWQAEPVVDGDQRVALLPLLLQLLGRQVSRSTAARASKAGLGARVWHAQHVPSMAVSVEQADVKDADAMDIARGELPTAHLSGVTLVGDEFLQRGQLHGEDL